MPSTKYFSQAFKVLKDTGTLSDKTFFFFFFFSDLVLRAGKQTGSHKNSRHFFKKGRKSTKFLVEECAQYWLTA